MTPQKGSIRFVQDHSRVLIIVNGELIGDVTWQMLDQILDCGKSVARQAEEYDKAAEIAKDAALLLRAGVPIGLSNSPTIQDEAVKHALHDRELRRAIPSVKSEEVFGTPIIVGGK
jgi:hypothetical protein